jgi:hypothetical protein
VSAFAAAFQASLSRCRLVQSLARKIGAAALSAAVVVASSEPARRRVAEPVVASVLEILFAASSKI